MQELSMNILDIAENSVRAGAGLIEIRLVQDTEKALQTLVIADNGKGMSPEMVQRVTDPFCTTRTTRKVGLGLPFLKMAAEMAGGSLTIHSEEGRGTVVTATFALGHIDLMPLGDMAATLAALVQCNPAIDFVYTFRRDAEEFAFDTREAREILGGVPLSEPAVAVFVREYIAEHMQAIAKPEETV
ncbi:MAG: ATP-binding protein [Oscillospiraceae bacterium]